MMTSNVGPGELVQDLRATLELISVGLIEGLPDRLLDAEPRLAEIAARLATTHPGDLDASGDDLRAARTALTRCERLGATVGSLAEVYGAGRAYGRSGHHVGSDAVGVLHARV